MEALLLTPISTKYGITEKKKSEIDALTNQVIDTTAEVQQQQAIVTSLVEKSQRYQGYLLTAENNRTHALSNKALVDQVVQNAYNLAYNSDITFNKMILSSASTSIVSSSISQLINQLIFSVELVNKLANLVVRKKALNPLISDDLIARLASAGTDANNAVALTLIALKSTVAAEASVLEAEAVITLENKQATKLYETLTGENHDLAISTKAVSGNSLQALLYRAYDNAKEAYENAKTANDQTNKQLNIANTNLNKAQIKLQSLQAALAAANAAALAS
ncbi:hypothetical protein [Flavobacterium sp. H4147]|uniref:hypothetical protein n=1 Tax=Flavobacterium sp. H4147 TaxID=3034149 RepID=UPI0023ED4578|nr:hypothetical protein [Flavobacterium sp. H4147]